MLVVLLKVKGLCKMSTLEDVLAKRFSGKVFEMNLKISRRAYEEVKTLVG